MLFMIDRFVLPKTAISLISLSISSFVIVDRVLWLNAVRSRTQHGNYGISRLPFLKVMTLKIFQIHFVNITIANSASGGYR